MLEVRIARLSSEVCSTSGVRSASSRRSPAAAASPSPFAERSTSTQPVNRPSEFHTLSPCRSKTKVAMQGILPIQEMGERLEVGKRLPALAPPVPFFLDRGLEA